MLSSYYIMKAYEWLVGVQSGFKKAVDHPSGSLEKRIHMEPCLYVE